MLQRLRLGRHTVIHNTRSRAIVLAERRTCDFLDDPDLPGANATLSEWRAAGLFDDAPYWPERAIPLDATAHTRTLIFDGPAGPAAIALPEGMLSEQIEGMLSFCSSGDHADTVPDYVIAARDGHYTAHDAAGPVTETLTLDEARFFVIRAICETLLGASNTAAVLHGAAVSLNGSALLLLGQSGSGKTTTALGLLDAGCGLVADDFAPIHASGRDVMAFPTPLGLKGSTLALPEAQSVIAHANSDMRPHVNYVWPRSALSLAKSLPIVGIVFPRYTRDAPFSLERLPPEAAFISAISEGGRINPHHGSAAPLVHLFDTVPAWELRFERSEQSVPACLSLFATALEGATL